MKQVAVLGAGSFGTALAVHLANIGHDVRLWARDPELAVEMARHRSNPAYLRELAFPASIAPTSDLEQALEACDLVVSVVPSHGTRDVIERARGVIRREAVVVTATKGLEEGTLLRPSEVMRALLPGHRVATISGPSFAVEVGHGLPTAVVVASEDPAVVTLVQAEFRSRFLRLYGSSDLVGVEIGGALKNVIAIAAGVVEGMSIGHNAQAGLITRGLAEITRLATALGGRAETLAGLAGLGDLVLTCTGSLSRNRYVGVELARGRSLDEIVGSMKMVAEGVKTTGAALELGARAGVELPIAQQMADVLAGRRNARAALEELMLRPQRAEAERG